jgi:hypothetical protein
MNLFISCLISTVGAALADTESLERGLIYPLSIEPRTGAKANYWRPQSIPGTKIATQGYATAYAEARVSLFEYFAIERVRYESTVGTPGVQREFSAIETTDDKIRARIFDGIVALYIPSFRENPFKSLPKHGVLCGPGFRLQNEVYNGRLVQTQPKIVVQDHFDETVEEADLVTPAGQSHRFVTEFRQEIDGLVAHYSNSVAYGHFLAGLGHLRFRKPWTPSFSSTNNVFFSTIEAYGSP